MTILANGIIRVDDFVLTVEAGEDITAGDVVFIATGTERKSVTEAAGSGTAGSGTRAGITVVVPAAATRLNAFSFITTLTQSQDYDCNVRRTSFTGTILASFTGTFSVSGGNIAVRKGLDIAVTPGETLYIDFDGPNNAKGNAAAGVNADITSHYYNGTSWVAESSFQYAAYVQFDYGTAGLLYKAYAQTHPGTGSGYASALSSGVDTITAVIGFAINTAAAGADVLVLPLPLVRGLSGLTIGSKYYLKDITVLADGDAGGKLSVTQGSSAPLMGISVSATALIRSYN